MTMKEWDYGRDFYHKQPRWLLLIRCIFALIGCMYIQVQRHFGSATVDDVPSKTKFKWGSPDELVWRCSACVLVRLGVNSLVGCVMSTGGSGNGAAEVQARLTSPCDPALCGATVHPHQDQPALPWNVQPPVCPRKVGSPALSYTYTHTNAHPERQKSRLIQLCTDLCFSGWPESHVGCPRHTFAWHNHTFSLFVCTNMHIMWNHTTAKATVLWILRGPKVYWC